ncbi:unnamed protein product [Prorocentrum cordatum]|uniref:Uncharacterized protein n=1 Tax=Prorocentrum cordatum TaxID=2364126 RepID=A0ABN9TYI8_9DINO|nr:unnamed protein product [Polarella glacialis]
MNSQFGCRKTPMQGRLILMPAEFGYPWWRILPVPVLGGDRRRRCQKDFVNESQAEETAEDGERDGYASPADAASPDRKSGACAERCEAQSGGSLPLQVELSIQEEGGLHWLARRLGDMASLQILTIESCDDLEMLPERLADLRSLQQLTVWDCDRLRSLPERLGDLASLQDLKICECGQLQHLPERLGDLASLQRLLIESCDCLALLPERLGELTSLQQLTSVMWQPKVAA